MSEKEQPVTSEAAPAEETPPAEKEAPAAPTIEEKYVGEKVNPSAPHSGRHSATARSCAEKNFDR